jgi:two-component system, OmpR family, KDP operon response regulator KdpE
MIAGRVLVVDDEAQIRKFLRIALEAQGFAVSDAATADEGIARCATLEPHLVILDLGLPDRDGVDVISRIREWSTVPILVLSVRQGEVDKVAALDAGANDFVVKPFGMAEFLARARALTRTGGGAETSASVSLADLTIDFARHEVLLSGKPVRLTRREFDLLGMLARHAGRVVTHNQLLREIWGKAHETDTQYLRVFVSQLRRKLGDDPAAPKYILNEPGVGYRMIDLPAGRADR